MSRVVIDTNILVSALLTPQGPAARVLRMSMEQDKQLCVSAEVFAEYEEVLNRARFNFRSSAITAALCAIREKGRWVKPAKKLSICDDPDDDIFLECAEAAAADYLVTGNQRHFPHEWGSLKIVSPREFLRPFDFDPKTAVPLPFPEDPSR